MPRKGQAHAIDDEWRREVESRLAARGWKRIDLAKSIRCSKSTITQLLNGTTNQSPLVPVIEKTLGMRPRRQRRQVERDIDDVIADMSDMECAQVLGAARLIRDLHRPR